MSGLLARLWSAVRPSRPVTVTFDLHIGSRGLVWSAEFSTARDADAAAMVLAQVLTAVERELEFQTASTRRRIH
jgi:hypothetical protein